MPSHDHEIPPEFVRMARHLTNLGYAAADLAEQGVVGGSPAAIEADTDTFAGAWGSHPIREAYLLGGLLLAHAADHIRAVGSLLCTEGVLFSVLTLIRPTLEATAQARYLLAPDIDSRERVRRGQNMRLKGYSEALNILIDADEASKQQLRIRNFEIKHAADSNGFHFVNPRRRHGLEPERYLDSRTPSAQQLIGELLGSPGGNAGQLIHRMSSAVLHAQQHGLLMLIRADEAVPTDEVGISIAPMGMSLQEVARWTFVPILGLDALMKVACPRLGWQAMAWASATEAAKADWLAWLGGSP